MPENKTTFDDAAMLASDSELQELREKIGRERSPLARLVLMGRILAARVRLALQTQQGQAQGTRKPAGALYEFNEDRKPAQRKRENTAAMELIAQVDAGVIDAKDLTQEQKQVIAKYSGTGGALIGADGKKGSPYEYYTPKPIVDGMWSVLESMGFAGGKVLDPCAGTGVFGAAAPENAVVDAVELNQTSGRVGQLVNDGPGYTTTIAPFEAVASKTPDDSYDAVITNVPFGEVIDRGGNEKLDPKYQDEPLENYFILRSLEKLRPGGVAAFVTPTRCVSGRTGADMRLRLKSSEIAEFIGAYRLPDHVFDTAATEAVTDVMFFRKYDKETREKIQELKEQKPEVLTEAKVFFDNFLEGKYFTTEGRRFVLGESGTKRYRFREIETVTSNAKVGEVGKLLRKLPDSRINWELLGTTETQPIVYKEGDTLYQAGQCLQLKGGAWVPVQDDSAKGPAKTGLTAQKFSSPYAAWEAGIVYTQAVAFLAEMIALDRAKELPSWFREVMADASTWSQSERKYWAAGLVGMSVQEVLEANAKKIGFNYSQEFSKLSQDMQLHYATAKGAPGKIKGAIKAGLGALVAQYSKKDGFTAFWRGDVQAAPTNIHANSAEGTFEGLRYKSKSTWVSIEDAKTIFGQDFEPFDSDDWCVDEEGTKVTKASDYYTGNLAQFHKDIDDKIARAANERVKAKLLRQKMQANSRVEKIDTSRLDFNLFSPFVTVEEKVDFLSKYVSKYATVNFDNGKARPDIQIPDNMRKTTRDKLLNRVGDYLNHGTITIGSITLENGETAAQALADLRKIIKTANEQFNAWARSNPTIQARLAKTAQDPEKLRFTVPDDQDPIIVPGVSESFKLRPFQAAYVRKQAKHFGGGNAFDVGLGKTPAALVSVQYVQAIGVKKKTVFVVPNSVLSNWRKESLSVYGTIEDCLFVGLREKGAGRYRVDPAKFDEDLNRIRENRHSKIYMTVQAFERLRFRDETIERFDSYMRSVDSSYRESEDKKKDIRNTAKLSGLIKVLKDKKGNAPFIEDLGIDSMVSDESHIFKNAAKVYDFTGGKYLSLPDAAKCAIDMQAKAWYLRGMSPAQDGVMLLTASPITNSPLEMYSMMSLSLGHERVNEMCLGIRGADEFMQLTCQIDSETNESIDGVVRECNVFTGLNNVGVLRKAMKEAFVIKTAKDVGEQIVMPDSHEEKSSVQLSPETIARLQQYKSAFRYITDVRAKKNPRGSREDFEAVARYFNEPEGLIASPFNLISKMNALIVDPDLDTRSTVYYFEKGQEQQALAAVEKFNALALMEERDRPGPMTKEACILGTNKVKDRESGTDKETYRIKVQAYINGGTRVQIDTLDPDTQLKFEALADAEKLDLDVSISPKIAALIENVKNERATPRGKIGPNEKSPIVKQLIFCDILPLHNKIKRALVKRAGIPAAAITFITGQSNSKPEEIQDVQDGFNAQGEDNIFSTVIANEKAEVGINLQKGTQAIHHITVGWTPDSLQQRNGRGVRQGNYTDSVNIYYYDANGTFDMARRAVVNKKASWIAQVMDDNGANHVDVSGGMSEEQLRVFIDSIGDTDAMRRIQNELEDAEKLSRANSNRERQLINIDTVQKQSAFIAANPDAKGTIARKALQLKNIFVQLRALDKKSGSTTLQAKKDSLKSELQARFEGIKEAVQASAKIFESGEPISLDSFIEKRAFEGNGKPIKDDDFLKLIDGTYKYSRYTLELIEDGPLIREFELDLGMAKSMLEQSVSKFTEQAGNEGGYPAQVIEAIQEGAGGVVGGAPVVTGMFLRFLDGGVPTLGVYYHGDGLRYNGLTVLHADAKLEKTQSRLDTVQGAQGTSIIYPGAPDYEQCLIEAARLEDAAAQQNKSLNVYSENAKGVSKYRKQAQVAEYSVGRARLPSPYFPLVVREHIGTRAGAVVLGSIYESQKKIVRSFTTGNYFIAEIDAGVVEGENTYQSLFPQAFEYAQAHKLVVTLADILGDGSLKTKTLGGLLNSEKIGDFKRQELAHLIATKDYETEDEIGADVLTWCKSEAPAVDWDGVIASPKEALEVVLFMGGPVHLASENAKREIRNKASQQAKAQLEAKMKAEGQSVTDAPAQDPAKLSSNFYAAGAEILGKRGEPIIGLVDGVYPFKDDLKGLIGYGNYDWHNEAKTWNVYESDFEKFLDAFPAARGQITASRASRSKI